MTRYSLKETPSSMFRICATARLFIDVMLPEVDNGIFLDTDIVIMDDIVNLWRRLNQFSPLQVWMRNSQKISKPCWAFQFKVFP